MSIPCNKKPPLPRTPVRGFFCSSAAPGYPPPLRGPLKAPCGALRGGKNKSVGHPGPAPPEARKTGALTPWRWGQGNGLFPLPFYAYWRAKGLFPLLLYAYWRAKGLFPLPPLNTCFKGGERTRAGGGINGMRPRRASPSIPPASAEHPL